MFVLEAKLILKATDQLTQNAKQSRQIQSVTVLVRVEVAYGDSWKGKRLIVDDVDVNALWILFEKLVSGYHEPAEKRNRQQEADQPK